jgi:hypothetical protein
MIDIVSVTGKFSAICRCSRCNSEYPVKDKYGASKSPIGHLCQSCKTAISAMTNPTQSSLNKVFNYDKTTGLLTHKHTTASGFAGDLATFGHSRGYLSVSIGCKQYLAHRIIFMMEKGYWPEHIDHINHDKRDNRWDNLREVLQADNNRNMPKQTNSSTGHVGVSFMKTRNKYRAYITVNTKAKHLGLFDTVEEAVAARDKASNQYGYHTNHGK